MRTLPDHSSLTRIRQRLGVDGLPALLRAGRRSLPGGRAGLGPRALLRRHQGRGQRRHLDSLVPALLLRGQDPRRRSLRRRARRSDGRASQQPSTTTCPPGIVRLPTEADAEERPPAAIRPGGCWRSGGSIRTALPTGGYRRTSDFRVSPTDPDATPMWTGARSRLGYHDHYVVDGGQARASSSPPWSPRPTSWRTRPMLDLLWRVCFRRKLLAPPGHRRRQVRHHREHRRRRGRRHPRLRPAARLRRTGRDFYGQDDVHLRRRAGRVPLPAGPAAAARSEPSTPRGWCVYRADAAICNACPVKAECTTSDHGRMVQRSFYADYLEKVRGYHATEAYKKAMRKRQVWVEPLFAEAKEWHGLRRLRLRGLDERQHPGAADRGRAEPEALAGGDGVGAAPCPLREPLALPRESGQLAIVSGDGIRSQSRYLTVESDLAAPRPHQRLFSTLWGNGRPDLLRISLRSSIFDGS